MPDELDDRLARLSHLVPEPPPDATERVRRAVLSASAVTGGDGLARRIARVLRRPARVLVAAAGVVAVGGVLAVLIIAAPGDGPASTPPGGLRPDVAALGTVRECAEPLLLVPCVEGTEDSRRAIPALAGAPWLYRLPGGGRARLSNTPPRPSLTFPAGVTYGQALDALLTSATLAGRLPEGTVLGPPLPDGVVLLRPVDPARGIAIDLRAPYGYSAGGLIYSPTLVSADPSPGTQGGVWPEGAQVSVPDLPECMVLSDRASAASPCSPGAQASSGGPDPSVEPLPRVPFIRGETFTTGLTVPGERAVVLDLTLPVLRPGRDDPAAGGDVSLSGLRGRVVILSFVASWCEPCAHQARALQTVADRYPSGGGAEVLAVVVQDRRGPALAFLDAHDVGFTALLGPDDVAQQAFGVSALPETLLIDRQGRIARRIAGPVVDPDTVVDLVEALLAESP